jgi:hypothetical protein
MLKLLGKNINISSNSIRPHTHIHTNLQETVALEDILDNSFSVRHDQHLLNDFSSVNISDRGVGDF